MHQIDINCCNWLNKHSVVKLSWRLGYKSGESLTSRQLESNRLIQETLSERILAIYSYISAANILPHLSSSCNNMMLQYRMASLLLVTAMFATLLGIGGLTTGKNA